MQAHELQRVTKVGCCKPPATFAVQAVGCLSLTQLSPNPGSATDVLLLPTSSFSACSQELMQVTTELEEERQARAQDAQVCLRPSLVATVLR